MTSNFQKLEHAIKKTAVIFLFSLVAFFDISCEFKLPPPAPDLFYKYNVLKVGPSPSYLLSSDFNLDGFPDLLSANGNGHTATLLLGKGDGTFNPARNLKIFPEPSYAATGDLNKDGFPDIVLNSKGANGLSILLGYGNGNFRPAKKISTGRVPLSAILDDFNNDSHLDIAVSLTFNKLEIYIGTGNGQFKKGNTYATGSRARSIVSGYFNKDNFKDIAIASNSSGSSSLRIFEGNGDGSFSLSHKFAKGKSLFILAKADMNENGWQDLVAASAQGDNMYLLKSTKDGKFSEPIAFSAGGGPAALTIGQFDNDNLNDVAVANGRSSSFSVIFRTPQGGFRHPPRDYIVDGGTPLAITSGDYNKDGKIDIAVASAAKDIVEIYLGRKFLPGSSSSKPGR